MKQLLRILVFTMAVLLLTACGQTDAFVPLPPPVGEKYPMIQIVQTVGETEQVSLQSPFAEVKFGQTGSFAGGIKLEEICLKQRDLCATMLATTWGSWQNATIERAEAFNPEGQLLGAWIEESLPQASLLQWLSGCASCTITRSKLIFEYISPEPGATPRLENVYYFEEWGLDNNNPMAFGTAHVWADPSDLFPEQALWGFWEAKVSPFQQVITALERAEKVLKNRAPNLQVLDADSAGRELIGRQTGLTIKRNGEEAGSVVLSYANGWGQMPNTNLIGKGALSKIEWFLGEQYYAMLVLSPVLSPEPTSLYVFCQTGDCVETVTRQQEEWPMLYEQIREKEIPGLDYAVYAIGHIGSISKSTGEGTVHIGEGGGVHYGIIGDPTLAQVVRTTKHLSLLGLNGVKAMGLYYATWPGSGSGLEYYLDIVRLAMDKKSLQSYGVDVGILDRVGFLPVD